MPCNNPDLAVHRCVAAARELLVLWDTGKIDADIALVNIDTLIAKELGIERACVINNPLTVVRKY